MEEYKEILEDILNYLDLLKNEYKYYKSRKEELDGIAYDGRHIIELANMDAIAMMLFVSEYRKLLRERREVIDKYKTLRDILHIINDDIIQKVEELYKDVDYAIRKNENKKYGARSKVGQDLINKYSKENDDLVANVTDDQLEDLKDKLEMANVS